MTTHPEGSLNVSEMLPVIAVSENGNDNFSDSIYGDGYKGLLIARCNQNGQHVAHTKIILDAFNNPQPDAALAQKAELLEKLQTELFYFETEDGYTGQEFIDAVTTIIKTLPSTPPAPCNRDAVVEECARVAEVSDRPLGFQTDGDKRRAEHIAKRIRTLKSATSADLVVLPKSVVEEEIRLIYDIKALCGIEMEHSKILAMIDGNPNFSKLTAAKVK